jgi:hypothetical protein
MAAGRERWGGVKAKDGRSHGGARPGLARRAYVAFSRDGVIYPEPQRANGQAWQHFRAPDGNVYEIIGSDDCVSAGNLATAYDACTRRS